MIEVINKLSKNLILFRVGAGVSVSLLLIV